MKAFRLIIAFLCIATIGCSSDDDTNNQTPETEPWNLVRITGGFAGVDQTLPEGIIMWTFNEDTQMVEVVNNTTDDTINYFFESGTYSYSIEMDGPDEIITVDGIELGTLSETENELIIDHQVDDGFTLTFTK